MKIQFGEGKVREPDKVQGHIEKIQVLSDIPMGHKFALKDMDEGEAVIKHGEPIGQSTAKISRGEHPKC